MAENVVKFEPAFERTDMTPEQALASASTEFYNWEKVIVCGFVKEHGNLIVRTSHMSRADALWIAEHLRQHALGYD